MVYGRAPAIFLLSTLAAIATAVAGERTTLAEPTVVGGQKQLGRLATKDARTTPITPLDRVTTAVDGAESSHGKDIGMWRPDPSGPQGPMQVSEAAATDVGGGDRFDLSQNRAIGRAYLARLYRRYKNWPDAIAAYNWGLSKLDTWIKAGRPAEKLQAGVAAYTMRVLYDSGLCYVSGTNQLRRPPIFAGEAEFRALTPDPSTHSIFAHFDARGGAFTTSHRYLCATAPNSSSKAWPLRLRQGAAPPQSLFEQITASARSSWRASTSVRPIDYR